MGRATAILSAAFSIASLLSNLLILWMSLSWRVRKARKAFEKELIREGMSRENAKRLSAQYKILKDQITSTITRSFREL